MPEKLFLDDNRFFDSDSTVRRIAGELYANVKDLPIVSPVQNVKPFAGWSTGAGSSGGSCPDGHPSGRSAVVYFRTAAHYH